MRIGNIIVIWLWLVALPVLFIMSLNGIFFFIENTNELIIWFIFIIIVFVVLLVVVNLSGCSENKKKEEYSIVGTWNDREYLGSQMIFREDGTCYLIVGTETIESTYTINETTISFTIAQGANSSIVHMKYKFLSEDIMSISNPLTAEQTSIMDRVK